MALTRGLRPLLTLLPLAGCTARQAYFNTLGDDLEAVASSELDAATTSVQVAMYAFDSDGLKNALMNAVDRGIPVQLCVDSGQLADQHAMPGVVADLREHGVTVGETYGQGPGAYAAMHNKFAVIDENVVLTGSYNWTDNARDDNDENLLVLHDPAIAAAYAEDFTALWERCSE